MNKTYKYTLTAHEKKEISFDTGVARLAITNGDGVDGSTTVVMSEITKQYSGDIVSFLDGADAPFADFIVNIVATQSGSGDPSPTNVRPITGWTGANVYVSGEDTSDPTTYNIDWQSTAGTVYGGTLNVKTGELTVTRVEFKIKDVAWNRSNNGGVWPHYIIYMGEEIPNLMYSASIISDAYKEDRVDVTILNDNCFTVLSNNRIYLRDDAYNSASDFVSARGDNVFVYYLATPATYHLTPVEIRSLLGLNNVWADCGSVNVRYFVQSTQPMIDYIDDKTENVTCIFKATDNGGGVYTLDDITCDKLCLYARDHSNIVLKVARYNSAIAYDIFILSDYIGTSAVFRHTMITSAIGGGYVLYIRELQADSGTATNVLTTRDVNITADT